MSAPTPPPGPDDPPGWSPPSGWSPEQPAAWPAQPPPPGTAQTPPPGPSQAAPPGQGHAPPPGYAQGPAPGYGQPPAPGYGQPPAPGYGQPPAPGYGQPPAPGYGQPPAPGYGQSAGWSQSAPWGPPPPAPKPGIVPLRPLGVGELLDGALSLIRSNPRTVLGLAAVISSVSAILQTIGLWVSLRLLDAAEPVVVTGTATEAELTAELATLASSGIAQLLPALVAGFLQVLASGLFIVLVGAAVLGRQLDAGQTWAILRPRLLPLIGVTLLIGIGATLAVAVIVAVIVGLTFAMGPWAVLPGLAIGLGGTVALVYAYVKLAVASPALVIEGVGVISSMRRSWSLARGSWWRVLGILILALVITSLLTTVVTVPITLVASLASGFSESLLPTVLASGLATLVAGIITLPFSAAVTGLLYIDLRMRREALDIELTSAGVEPTADPLAAYRRRS